MSEIQLTFPELMELLMGRHSTNIGGNTEWVDWDAIYSDLLDEGYESEEASFLLDDFIEDNGY